MAREYKQFTWCDLCLELDGEQVEGEEMPPIMVGNKKPRVLAVCKQHQVDFFDKFVEVLESAGIVVDQLESGTTRVRSSSRRSGPRGGVDPMTTSTGKSVVCPIDECDSAPLKNISTVASHLRKVHGMNLFEAIGKDGQLYDVDGAAIEMPEVRQPREKPAILRTECDFPGCASGEDGGPAVYEFPKNQKPVQALGVHKAKVHGIKGAGKNGSKKKVA